MKRIRLLSLVLAFCMALGMIAAPAYADGTTMTITLVIPKKTPAASDFTYTAPSNLVYSDSNKAATVTAKSGVTGMGTITVKYYSDASRTTEATPKNVNTYYVGITVAEGDQYAASTSVIYGDGWTFAITSSTPGAPAAPTKASATKNSITLNAVSGCEYSKDGTTYQDSTQFTGLAPGTEYTFYQRVKATANTNASPTSSAKFSTEADTYAMTITLVIKPEQTITASDVDATYGDTDKSINASVTTPATGGGAVSYAVKDGSGDYISVASNGKLTIKAVPADGKAYVIVTAAGTDDYAETTKEVTVNISKAEVTVAAKDQSIYIGGTVPTLEGEDFYTVTGLVGEDALTTAPTLAYQKDGEAATPDNTTEGTYDIVPSGASAGDNYDIKYTNGTLTISEKQPATVTKAPEAKTLTYNGSAQELVTAGTAEGGTMYYAVTTENVAPTDDNLYTTSIPTATNAGTYYVWYMAKGDENHSDSYPAGPIAVTIAEATGAYSIKSTQGIEHILGEEKDAVYTVTNSADDKRAFERFTGVSVDGKALAAENYTKASGSLVLTLKSAYLNTLSVGKHPVKISFSDGEVEASLTIKESTPTPTPKPVPKTGDQDHPGLWIILMLIGIAGLTVLGTLKASRKRK